MADDDQVFEPKNDFTVGILYGYLYAQLEAELSHRSRSVQGTTRKTLEHYIPDLPLAPETLAFLCRSIGRYLEEADEVDGIMDGQQPHAARTFQDWGERLLPPDDPLAEGELKSKTLFHLHSDVELYPRALGAMVDRIRDVEQGKDGG